jgi:hypothetical protein
VRFRDDPGVTDDDAAWVRLGMLLIAARVGKGYTRRSAFARDLGLTHDRTLFDIENAKRRNFDASTLAFIEQAYGWKPGSIRTVLNGGEPTVTQENSRPEGEVDHRPVGLGLDDAAEGLTAEEIEPVLEVIRMAKRLKGLGP